MTTADRLKNSLFGLLAGGLFAFALAGAVLSATYIRLDRPRMVQVAFCAAAFFCLWFFSRRVFAVGAGLLAGGVILLWGYLHSHAYAVPWFETLSAYVSELALHVRGLTPYEPRFQALGVAIVALFALAACAAVRAASGFYFLSLLGFGVFGLLAYLGYATPKEYLICFLLVFLGLLARKLGQTAAWEGGDLALRVSGLSLLPICLAVLGLAAMLPQPQAASGRDIRDNVRLNLSAAEAFIYNRFAPKYFNFSTTGFSGTGGRLGGNVRPSGRYVMTVTVPDNSWPYLAGAYQDTYLGDRWAWSQPERALDPLPGDAGWAEVGDCDLVLALLAPESVPRETMLASLLPLSQTITIQNGRTTRAVFAPPGTLAAGGESTSASLFSRSRSGGLQVAPAMNKDERYAVAYLPPVAHELADSPRMPGLDAIGDRWDSLPESIQDALAPYLALPDTLPARVRELAAAIVAQAGANSPYAKMRALEDYLQQFPYTLEPGPVPEGADFVDYFLFEGQRGYCTYYATALAVMGRCVGVPTRYAEGFALPGEQNETGGYDVTNAQAHAWCEAFLSPYGWTPFEATAPYGYPFYNGGRAAPAPQAETSGQPSDEVERFDEDALMAEIRTRSRDDATTPTETPEPDGPVRARRMGYFAWTLGGMLAAALLICAGRYALYRRRLARLETLPNREAALAYFSRILGLMALRGAPMLPGETAAAYALRLDGGPDADGPRPMSHLAGIFNRAAYSRQSITQADRIEMAAGYERLLAESDANTAATFFRRYILGQY